VVASADSKSHTQMENWRFITSNMAIGDPFSLLNDERENQYHALLRKKKTFTTG
jgi:hypothetical protein